MEYKKEPYASWINPERIMTYFFYKTKDDSISVSLKSENYSTELMHSVDGAFSETIYLYEDVIKHSFRNEVHDSLCFLSLGLGMGYIEILVCAYTLKNFPNKSFKLFSFEKEFELRDFFEKYILEESIPDVFKDSYDKILNLFATHYAINPLSLKSQLKNKLIDHEINLCGEYNLEIELPVKINGLFFDAFSINTSPDLWTDELIRKILGSCASHAAFATYAARTHLKKLLLENKFNLEKKKGYGGKKESTFAYRSTVQ